MRKVKGNRNEDNCQIISQQGEVETPLLLTAKEAASMCRISESHFYKLNQAGVVPKSVRVGNIHRWRKQDLVEWVQAGCPKHWKADTDSEVCS